MTKSPSIVRLGTLAATVALAAAALLVGENAWLSAQAGGGQQTVVTRTIGVGGDGAGVGGPLGGDVPMAPVQQTGTGLFVGQVIDADSNRPIAGAIVTLGGAAVQGVIQGQRFAVSVSPGGGPVSIGAPSQNPRVLTDGDGRFVFQNVPKGSYNFTATKPGYVDGAYGRLRPAGSSQSIDLDDGERRGDVKVRVFRYAAISGTVTDETGEPVVGVSVRAFRRTLVAGRRLLSPTSVAATTDDRGVYRLGTLSPGEYVVGAPVVQASTPAAFQLNGGIPPDLLTTLSTPGGGFSINTGGVPVTPDAKFLLQNSGRTITPPTPNGRLLVYGSQYYPNSGTTQQATAIAVKSGEERSGVDLSLRLVPALNISGRLVGPDGPAVNWGVHLVPGDTSDLSGDPDVATSITDNDGTFMFLAIPAGQYVIQTVRVPRPQPGPGNVLVFQSAGGGTVSTFSSNVNITSGTGPTVPPTPTDPTLWTVMPVTLANDDVSDLTLALHAGYKVSGHVEFTGSAQKPTPDRMSSIPIVLEPADAKQKMTSVPGRVDPSGNFTTMELLPGKYLVRVGGAPSGWTFKSAMLGGVDVAETPIDLSERDIQGVVVAFNDTPTDLRGIVRSTEGGADDSAAVVVFPADSKSWMDYGLNPRRVRLSRTSKTGAYQFGALPPGDYYVAAFSEEFAGEWQDPGFLDQLSRGAAHLTLNDGEKRTQDLTRLNVRPGLEPSPESRPLPSPPPSPLFSGPGPFVPDEDIEQAGQVRDAASAPVAGTGVVSGVVLLDDPSQTPIRHARVTLHPVEGKGDRLITTDDSGRFAFVGVPAGVYSLAAAKPAYVTVYYGSKHPGRGPGTTINVVKDQALTDLKLSMPRGSVITGTALDDFGSPVPNARVSVQQYRTVNGERTLSSVSNGFVSTDDRGVYRAYGLALGAYVVSIAPPPFGAAVRQLSPSEIQTAVTSVTQGNMPRPNTSSGTVGANMTPQPTPAATPVATAPLPGRPVGYSTLYYPGTWSAAEAQTITVGVGQEVTGIDIPMHLVPTARLEGIVVGPDGQPLQGATVLMAQIADTGAVTIATSLRTSADGRFSTQNLAPGRYALTARANGATPVAASLPDKVAIPPGAPPPPPPPPPGANLSFSGPLILSSGPTMRLWAQQDVDINGEDVSGVTLVLQEGMTLSGKVLFDGRVPPPATQDLTKITIQLRPEGRNNFLIGVPPSNIDASGTFTLGGIAPGKYRLTATVPGATPTSGWQLRSAMIDGRDAADIPIEIKAGQHLAGAVVTFTDSMAELSGRLIDAAGRPAPGLTVLLFPTDRAQWVIGSRRMPQPILPSNDGKFRAASLPAGDYFLAAVTDLDQEDWGDPTFMEQAMAGAIKITLADGERKMQDLRVAGSGSS